MIFIDCSLHEVFTLSKYYKILLLIIFHLFINSCHAIDNPSMRSEITMLRQYGPNVPEETLSRLVKAFSELRTMADEGHIQVNICFE